MSQYIVGRRDEHKRIVKLIREKAERPTSRSHEKEILNKLAKDLDVLGHSEVVGEVVEG